MVNKCVRKLEVHLLLCSKHLRLLSKSLRTKSSGAELSLKWYKNRRSVMIVWVLLLLYLLFFILPSTLLHLLRLWLHKRHLNEKKNKSGRNMNESNISLIAQLRECEDADNGPVLIKLFFFFSPCVVFLLQAIFLKMQFSFNSHIKCSCCLSFSRLCSFPCTKHGWTFVACFWLGRN